MFVGNPYIYIRGESQWSWFRWKLKRNGGRLPELVLSSRVVLRRPVAQGKRRTEMLRAGRANLTNARKVAAERKARCDKRDRPCRGAAPQLANRIPQQNLRRIYGIQRSRQRRAEGGADENRQRP